MEIMKFNVKVFLYSFSYKVVFNNLFAFNFFIIMQKKTLKRQMSADVMRYPVVVRFTKLLIKSIAKSNFEFYRQKNII